MNRARTLGRRSISLGGAGRTAGRRLTLAASAALLLFGACGDLPATTENARGVITGPNLVLAMSAIFLVVAVGLLVAAVGTDRFFKSRAALAEGTPADIVEEEETDEVVAGITVGRAAVPRWLYGAYVLIPVFAFAYVFSNLAPPQAAEPVETEAPSGPCTECEIDANQIVFDKELIEVTAGEEITVTLDNQDVGVPHDFSVYVDEAAADADLQDFEATTGTVAGGASGNVSFNADDVTFFICTIHPASMRGAIEAV